MAQAIGAPSWNIFSIEPVTDQDPLRMFLRPILCSVCMSKVTAALPNTSNERALPSYAEALFPCEL